MYPPVEPPVVPPPPPPVSPNPDLIIDNVTHSPTNPSIGDPVTFTVKVKNQGTSGATDFHVQLVRAGYAAQWFVPSLAPGASTTLTTSIPLSTSPETFTATADNLNEVLESNEMNNSAKHTITAGTPPGPRAYVALHEYFLVISIPADTLVAEISAYCTGGVAVVGEKVYVTEPNDILVIDAPTCTVVNSIGVGSGQAQRATIGVFGSKIYVTNSETASVAVVNTLTDTVAGIIDVGRAPRNMVVNGDKAYVSNSLDNSVSVISTLTDSVVATIPVGSEPNEIAFAGSKAYVATGGGIWVVDTLTDTITTAIDGFIDGHPVRGYFITIDQGKAYLTSWGDGRVFVIDTSSDTAVDTISVGSGANDIEIAGDKAYVANYDDDTVSAINTVTRSVCATVAVGHLPLAIAITSDGSKAYVVGGGDPWRFGSISVIDTATDSATTLLSRHGFTPFPTIVLAP